MPRKIAEILLWTFSLAASPLFGDQNCSNCEPCDWPWADECKKCCTLKVLQVAPIDELTGTLKLDNESAKKVVSRRTKGQLNSVTDLNKTLPDSQIKMILERLNKLTPKKREDVLKPLKGKTETSKPQ